MTKYRIKTEQEFINEFGNDWREIGSEFLTEMDYLLGTEIHFDLYKHELNSNNTLDLDNYLRVRIPKLNPPTSFLSSTTWAISQEMIKEMKPNYNEKKVLVYD